MRTLIIAGILTFLIDQVSKYWVVHILELDRVREIDILPPFLNFRMAWNYGINFGLFQGDTDTTRWILIAIALVISAAQWMTRYRKRLLIGGAMGNVVDRLVYGAVADFLNMSCCGIDNPYAFNVADIAVFAGALGMVIFTGEKKAA